MTHFFSGSAAEGACPLNPPTPERIVGAGVWGNKLLVVKKGLINTIINTIHGPGARGAEVFKQSPWAPRGLPGRFWGFPEGYFGGGAEVPRGVFWGGGWGSSRGILGRGLGNWGAGLDRESGLPCGLQEAKGPQPQRSIADTRW